MTNDNRPFMPQRGNYRNLIVYQKAECIYDITYYFAHKFLEKRRPHYRPDDSGGTLVQAEYSRGKRGKHHVEGNRTEADQRGAGEYAGASGRL